MPVFGPVGNTHQRRSATITTSLHRLPCTSTICMRLERLSALRRTGNQVHHTDPCIRLTLYSAVNACNKLLNMFVTELQQYLRSNPGLKLVRWEAAQRSYPT